MTDTHDKAIRQAAKEGLRLLATEGDALPAAATLMRAADAPTVTKPDVLLRPAVHTPTSESEGQLLRAVTSDTDTCV